MSAGRQRRPPHVQAGSLLWDSNPVALGCTAVLDEAVHQTDHRGGRVSRGGQTEGPRRGGRAKAARPYEKEAGRGRQPVARRAPIGARSGASSTSSTERRRHVALRGGESCAAGPRVL